ncbi:hypothetical protein [Bdellovibrio sp. HCB337]|uniref:hypothetical protein n=1 Tax=Bdellovibrio sp. HCB337 TaxID=3394358 RepID=UPI0039A5CB93
MDLIELTKISDEQRDPQWENDFFMQLSEGKLKLLSQDPQVGPDGWPYLMTETSPDAEEPAQKIIHWLATKGMGLVVNPNKEYPDYVFSYGMLWHFRETGLFYRAKPEVSTGSFELRDGAQIHAGEPTPQYLPQYVRNILKEFFRDQSVYAPKILVMSTDRVNYDLAFSLESLSNPPVKEHQGIAEAISWFLPPHYSIVLVSEKGLPPFVAL